jgi:hypothetical protein
MDTQKGDSGAVDEADGRRQRQREHHAGYPGWIAGGREQRQGHAGDRDHRADRKVDPAADHNKGLAGSDDADSCGELDHVAQVAVAAEAAAGDARRNPDQDHDKKGQEGAACEDPAKRSEA